MKDKNPRFQETQWITSRINVNKYVHLHHRETTENQKEDLEIIQREKMDYLQRNEKAVNGHLNNDGSQWAGEKNLYWIDSENLWT